MTQTELRGVIFKDPMAPDDVEAGWQTADEYLSGDVRSKLRIAQMAANRDSAFNINVEALQKAQPKDLDEPPCSTWHGCQGKYHPTG